VLLVFQGRAGRLEASPGFLAAMAVLLTALLPRRQGFPEAALVGAGWLLPEPGQPAKAAEELQRQPRDLRRWILAADHPRPFQPEAESAVPLERRRAGVSLLLLEVRPEVLLP